MSKEVAIEVVKERPDISQGELADLVEVTDRAITGWTPDLLAAGWKGPHAAKKRQEPTKPKTPKRSTPSLPTLEFMEGEGPEDN